MYRAFKGVFDRRLNLDLRGAVCLDQHALDGAAKVALVFDVNVRDLGVDHLRFDEVYR